MFERRIVAFAVALTFAVLGCSEDLLPPLPEGAPDGPVTLRLTADPAVSYDAASGKTTVVVQYVARGTNDVALASDEMSVDLFLDSRVLDSESILEEDSEDLAANIHLGLVLDASYSMLQHAPPAFTPMLTAAKNAIEEGDRLYEDRAGSFTWELTWFNELVCNPSEIGRDWTPNDILAIPAPNAGTATKLFGAVKHGVDNMIASYATTANGPNDHHILVVFSDGADNYSWFDNATQHWQNATSTGATYEARGLPPTSLGDALAAIGVHPGLTVHTIGLGSNVADHELAAIAEAGDGRYYKNLSSTSVATLFDQVVREFATIQTSGATIPLQPGEYAFMLRVWNASRTRSDEVRFRLRAGGTDAGVVDGTIQG